ncbi:MAG: hypothetical protein AAF639_36545 [Chloroflexota bacterium]
MHKLITLFMLFLLVACSTASADKIIDASPDEVAASLTTSDSLAAAVDELAGVLDMHADSIKIRLRATDCMVCNEAGNEQNRAGMTVDEATALLPDSDAAWLFVQNISCFYMMNGDEFVPKSCSAFEQ